MAIRSRSREHAVNDPLFDGLAVFQTVSDDAQRERLNSMNRSFAGWAVCKYARKIEYFRKPPAICFWLGLNRELHGEQV